MGGAPSSDALPFFLGATEQRIFALASRPSGESPSQGILVCPPFAEEMNRTRRTTRMLVADASVRDVLVLNPDLYGTGDSPGDFGEARWDRWLADIGVASTWLLDQGCTGIFLVGIRGGALLAWDFLKSSRSHVAGAILWQPMLSGKSVVTDLLRARVAASAAQGAGETVVALRKRLADGEPVETAGYMLSPELVVGLERISLDGATPVGLPPIFWIEIVSSIDTPARPAAVRIADQLRVHGAAIELLCQPDPPFWGTTETTVGKGTVAATLAWLQEKRS